MTTQIRGSSQIKNLNLTNLSDVNASSPNDGEVLAWDNDGSEWIATTVSGVSGSSTFTGLTDTPSSYSGQGGKVASVKGDETGLEFVTPSGSSSWNLGTPTELTISSGAVTITGHHHIIDTESDASSDDLDTINGGTDGDFLVIRNADNARDVVVRDGRIYGGNIYTRFAGSVTLDETVMQMAFIYSSTHSAWLQFGIDSDNRNVG